MFDSLPNALIRPLEQIRNKWTHMTTIMPCGSQEYLSVGYQLCEFDIIEGIPSDIIYWCGYE